MVGGMSRDSCSFVSVASRDSHGRGQGSEGEEEGEEEEREGTLEDDTLDTESLAREIDGIAMEIQAASWRHRREMQDVLEPPVKAERFKKHRRHTLGGRPARNATDGEDAADVGEVRFCQGNGGESVQPIFLPAHDVFINQSFFLKAAFDLIRTKHDLETQVLEALRVRYPELPTGGEALMFGELKKVNSHSQTRNKFFVVSTGCLSYVNATSGENHLPSADPSGAQGAQSLGSPVKSNPKSEVGLPLLLFGKKSSAKKVDGIKRVRLWPGTRCLQVKKKSGKFYFEIHEGAEPAERRTGACVGSPVDSTDDKSPTDAPVILKATPAPQEPVFRGLVLCAPSEAEGIRWMNVIAEAAELKRGDDNFADACFDNLIGLRSRFLACRNSTEYVRELATVFDLPQLITNLNREQGNSNQYMCDQVTASRSANHVDVPLEWLHSVLNMPRGGITWDGTDEQLFKDMQRDSVVINGRLYSGWSAEDPLYSEPRNRSGSACSSSGSGFAGPGLCSIVCALAREIQLASQDLALTEAEALSLSHQVLLVCNRTQSGGNTYDAVNAILGNSDLTLVAHDAENVPPLQITVYRAQVATLDDQVTILDSCSDEESFSPSLSPKGMLRKGVQGTVSAHDLFDLQSSDGLTSPASEKVENNGRSPTHEASHRKVNSDISELVSTVKSGGSGDSFASDVLAGSVAPQSTNANAHVVSGFKMIKAEIRKLNKWRGRRSEPFKLGEIKALEAISTQEPSLQFPNHTRDAGPRVDVQVSMHYRLCDLSSDGHEAWARVTATFKRTFALVGQRKSVALGQGSVTLSVSTIPRV